MAYGDMRFAEKLDRLIGLRGTSQSELSRKTGIAQSAISEMTKGRRRCYMDQAHLLARALDVTLDYLADDAQDDPVFSSEWQRKVAEIVAVIGPERAWRKLVGADQPDVVPKLIPPPARPEVRREEAG